MNTTQLIYLVFGIVLVVALLIDLGLMSRKNHKISLGTALIQTVFWVLLSMAFCGFIWYERGKTDAISYLSAYLLEWSLSVDNIFVFIFIFNFFKVEEIHYSRVLLLGILMAIIFRIIFITVGSELVARFDWIMYIFGGFLVYTGFKILVAKEEHEFDPGKSWAFRFMKKFMRTSTAPHDGKFFMRINGKTFATTLAMVVGMLGLIDIVFAVDSIPAVFSIIPDPRQRLLIYSSNIFAVLGLRSLFFLLHGAAARFSYLQHGVAIILIFIGLKMLVEHWLHIPIWASLMVIIVCITGSILYSIFKMEEENESPGEIT